MVREVGRDQNREVTNVNKVEFHETPSKAGAPWNFSVSSEIHGIDENISKEGSYWVEKEQVLFNKMNVD
jgi:hypothetical protein